MLRTHRDLEFGLKDLSVSLRRSVAVLPMPGIKNSEKIYTAKTAANSKEQRSHCTDERRDGALLWRSSMVGDRPTLILNSVVAPSRVSRSNEIVFVSSSSRLFAIDCTSTSPVHSILVSPSCINPVVTFVCTARIPVPGILLPVRISTKPTGLSVIVVRKSVHPSSTMIRD